MDTPRVLITGATGFIGGRLCEVVALNGTARPRAFIHSTGAVARIARLPLETAAGDLCDREAAEKAAQGCDAIVHLARGGPRVMRQGLDNLLRAAVNGGVKRFVHVSSVAVYGNHPPPESVSESAPVRRCDNEYGREKLRQERLVLDYARRSPLETVILRPPNVYGPFSSFTLGLIQRLRDRAVPVVNDGAAPCNLVYVDNLVQAILLALFRPEAAGQTFFVTDADVVTWKQCLSDHARWVGEDVPRVGSADLDRARQHVIRDSLRMLPRALVSSEFRAAIRPVPLVRAAEDLLYRSFESLPHGLQRRIRARVGGAETIPSGAPARRFHSDDPGVAAQFRGVVHSHEKARRLLGYTAPVSYREGMQLTGEWLRYSRIV